MSFLNPVNEPVLRFSSTDASAPQINYNARVAGDVKAVLKACLVTGYGAKASAGWSIANEVNYVAEFVSPSVDMSDYRFGIDDSSASSSVFSYFYADTKVPVVNGSSSKSFAYIDLNNAKNGWDLIVTDSGFYFIEQLYSTLVQGIVNRITWYGRTKLAVTTQNPENIGFWVAGYNAPNLPYEFFAPTDTAKKQYKIGVYSAIKFTAVNIDNFGIIGYDNKALSDVELLSPLYLMANAALIAQQPGLLLRSLALGSNTYDNSVMTINGRSVLPVFLARSWSSADIVKNYTRSLFIYLDHWEL